MVRRSPRVRILLILVALGALAFLIRGVWLPWLAAPLMRSEDPAKADQYKALEEKKKEAEEVEKAYKEMLKRTTPAQQPVKKADPWGNMR